MRIESITNKNLEKENNNELFSLRMRFSQLYEKFYKTNLFKKSDFNFIDRKDFLNKYRLLINEIKRRKLKVSKSNELDKIIFSKNMVGIDIKSLPDIPMGNDYISITGSFLKDPKTIGEFNIYIKEMADKRTVEIEERVKHALEEELDRSPAIVKHEEPEGDYLPVYELVLRPKDDLKVIKAADQIEKGVIAYKNYGHADEGTSWDAGREVRQMEVDQLRKYCAWYDSEKPDIKASYKLPHHRISDGKAVWRAVYAAMAVLLGARGGIRIPNKDRKGVYNHLKAHYKEWDKEPPELRKYDEEELKKTFPEIKSEYKCECIECGYKMTSDKHCSNIKCPKCGGEMRRVERPGPGKSNERKSGKSFPIKKPEETEDYIRIPINDCEVTATITISAKEGIKALYCGKVKKIRTYIFEKAKGWTMAKAKKWIKEHKEKMTKEENEHSARLQDPKKYDDWKTTKGGKIYFKIKIPASMSINWGHPKGKSPAVWIPQALGFPKDKYTVAQAKKFLSDNNIKYTSFEVAKKEEGQIKKAESSRKYFKFEKVNKKQQIVGGIIYEPDVEDTQGDYMEEKDIEKMAYKYMLGDKKIKINHKGKAYNFPIIESYIPDEDTTKGGQIIKKGAWWLMMKINNKNIWADIESGKLGGFSMGGVAQRKDI